jgi:hypothetical protein
MQATATVGSSWILVVSQSNIRADGQAGRGILMR